MDNPTVTPSTTSLSQMIEVKQRLPFREVTVRPSDYLRSRILELMHKTGKSAKEVLEMLLSQAAGMPIEWIFIQPFNGDEAGVALEKVENSLKKTFYTIRDVKGVIKALGTAVQKATIDKLMTESVTLWIHAQSLAKNTFYNNAELVAGRKVYRLVSDWINGAQKTIDTETAKGAEANQSVIAEKQGRIADYNVVLKVLARLGFSPAGPHHEI